MPIDPSGGFGERLRGLLERAGADSNESLRAAAKRIGISHIMLQRAIAGRVPKHDALVKIADAHGVSVDWLLRGKGNPPDWRDTFSAAIQWKQLIDQLELPPNEDRIMRDFPKSSMKLVYDLIADDQVTGANGSTLTYSNETPELREGIRTERQAWVQIFRDWIDQALVERVREQVIANIDWFDRRTGSIERRKLPESESPDR